MLLANLNKKIKTGSSKSLIFISHSPWIVTMMVTLAIVEFAIVAISSIVAVMNPLSTTAIFLTLTKGESPEKNRQIAAKAAKLGFIILASFALTGTLLFQIFNIELFSFQIAGGILLITIAVKMLSEKNGFSSDKREDPSIIPLTFPLTAGPGTIMTVILIFSQAIGIFEAIFCLRGNSRWGPVIHMKA
jgi:multiple antibiotic resistance protein